MLRLIDAVSCNVHHAIAECRTDEDANACNEQYGFERCCLCSDSRLKKIDRIITDTYHEVENREYEQKDDDTQINCFHRHVFYFRLQRKEFGVGCKQHISDSAAKANEALFTQLDSLIDNSDKLILQKEERIEALKHSLRQSKAFEKQYELNQAIYQEYRVYDADSAMKYTTQSLDLARQYHDKNREIESLLGIGFVYTANGLLSQASEVMHSLCSSSMPRYLRSRYYGQMRTLCSRLQLYSLGDDALHEHYGQLYALYSDSVLQTATPDEPRYLYSRVWKYQDVPGAQRIAIRDELEKEKQRLLPNSRNYSILAYNLALLYEKEHNHTKWLENMILSGIADVYAVNRDIGSLYALASYLYEQGQLDRAYRYSTYCSDIGITFKSRVRLLHQQKLQRRIHQSYIERDHMQQKQLKLFLLFISFLTIVLLIALFFLRRQTRRRRKALVELHVANGRLKSLNSELQKLNLVLRDTNYIKEEYIGQVFKLCSSYICRMEEYRKKLNRKLKAGQLEDLKKMISSTSTMSDEMKDFYEKFDSIILHLYPDFVEHFNSLLRPEEHIEVKSGRLNTELRIHALIRMGVTDSEKIAEFLHCSLQTVYNNRSITLNKSSLSKEEFLRAVKEVCKK